MNRPHGSHSLSLSLLLLFEQFILLILQAWLVDLDRGAHARPIAQVPARSWRWRSGTEVVVVVVDTGVRANAPFRARAIALHELDQANKVFYFQDSVIIGIQFPIYTYGMTLI